MTELTEKQALIMDIVDSEGLLEVTAKSIREYTGFSFDVIGGIFTGLIRKGLLVKGDNRGEWMVVE